MRWRRGCGRLAAGATPGAAIRAHHDRVRGTPDVGSCSDPGGGHGWGVPPFSPRLPRRAGAGGISLLDAVVKVRSPGTFVAPPRACPDARPVRPAHPPVADARKTRANSTTHLRLSTSLEVWPLSPVENWPPDGLIGVSPRWWLAAGTRPRSRWPPPARTGHRHQLLQPRPVRLHPRPHRRHRRRDRHLQLHPVRGTERQRPEPAIPRCAGTASTKTPTLGSITYAPATTIPPPGNSSPATHWPPSREWPTDTRPTTH
jgi:hypothetical protein